MCFEKEKVYLITLKILPSIHLTGSLQISDTIYWYNVNRGKICSKIVGHADINIIQGTIMEIHIATTYQKYINNIRLLLWPSHTINTSPTLSKRLMCWKVFQLTKANPWYYFVCDSQFRKWSLSKLFSVFKVGYFTTSLLSKPTEIGWYKRFLKLAAFWCHISFNTTNRRIEFCKLLKINTMKFRNKVKLYQL